MALYEAMSTEGLRRRYRLRSPISLEPIGEFDPPTPILSDGHSSKHAHGRNGVVSQRLHLHAIERGIALPVGQARRAHVHVAHQAGSRGGGDDARGARVGKRVEHGHAVHFLAPVHFLCKPASASPKVLQWVTT